jgi:hypothetical protein
MSSLRTRSTCCRRRTVRVLCFCLLLATDVGVRCFAIGEDRPHNNNLNKNRRGFTIEAPPKVHESVKDYRSAGLCAPLFEKKDGGDETENFDGVPDPSMNFTGPEPVDFLVPRVAPVDTTTKLPVATWPCFDKMDKELIRISLPVIGNYAINPLIGAVDLFWVNRMGNALAVAGQAAANQVFSSAFWFTSFLPSGKNNTTRSRQHVTHLLFQTCSTHNIHFLSLSFSDCYTGFKTARQWR